LDQAGWAAANPFAAVVRDSAGNLYGSTVYGGSNGRGTVFKLTKNGTFSVLLNFSSSWVSPGDGPRGPLVLDAADNLYGSAGGGGNCNGTSTCGVVFKLDPSGNETVIRNFLYGKKGFYPNAGLIRDAAGNLYGTTMGGGTSGAGVVFKLDSAGNETVLYTFKRMPDGSEPQAGLIQDTAGNFYGTTVYGGNGPGYCPQGCGVVFKLDANGNETVLYAFAGKSDGGGPVAPLVMDSAGNLYGTTNYEGGGGCLRRRLQVGSIRQGNGAPHLHRWNGRRVSRRGVDHGPGWEPVRHYISRRQPQPLPGRRLRSRLQDNAVTGFGGG
jgi:uncharacterized repeat protein (TIGR03803 family)